MSKDQGRIESVDCVCDLELRVAVRVLAPDNQAGIDSRLAPLYPRI
jgi:hypothetical protein